MKIKSESDRKRVCKSDGFGFVKKRRNLTDSKSDSKSVCKDNWLRLSFARTEVFSQTSKTKILSEVFAELRLLAKTSV